MWCDTSRKDCCSTWFSLWGHAAALSGNFQQNQGSTAKEFQQTLVVYFCSPLWCVWAKSNQFSPAWHYEAVQEGPVTPDGGLIAASEWVWNSGCLPRTTTFDSLKPWPLLKQHKALFRGPCLCCVSPFLLLSHLIECEHIIETGGRLIYSQRRLNRESNHV